MNHQPDDAGSPLSPTAWAGAPEALAVHHKSDWQPFSTACDALTPCAWNFFSKVCGPPSSPRASTIGAREPSPLTACDGMAAP